MAGKDRIRKENYLLALLPEEAALLQKNAFELDISRAEYLRRLIVYGGITGRQFVMNEEQGKQLLYEVNRIGNNINQIAYNTNVQKYAYVEDWKTFLEVFLEMTKLIGELPFMDERGKEEWQQRAFTLLRKL